MMSNDQSPIEERRRGMHLLCDAAPSDLPEDLELVSLAPEAIETALEVLAGRGTLASCRLTRLLSSGWIAPAARDRVVDETLAHQDADGWIGGVETTPHRMLSLLDLGVPRSADGILRAADALLARGIPSTLALAAVRLSGRAHDTRVEYALQTLALDPDGDLDEELLRVACLLEVPFEARIGEARKHLRGLSLRVLRGERPSPFAARSLRGIPEREAALILDLSLPSWLKTKDEEGLIASDPEVTCDVALALRIHELDQPA